MRLLSGSQSSSVVLLVACLGVTSSATADIIPIDPFDGQFSEDFESYLNYNESGKLDTLSIAGGAAEFSSNPLNSNQLYVIDPNGGAGWGLGGYGTAGTRGEQALGFFKGGTFIDVTLSLADPASELGFYFVTADSQGTTMTASFFDIDGNQLGSDQILDSLGNVYVWAGWSSATGIASVRFTGNVAPVLDDVQFNSIPGPASALVLSGMLMLGVGRRRH